ncbi:MAG TPA: PHP domain-containing protein [Gemmatimonadales bacterium]|nr:PHP domain-containing protein [Gemmatimonadales bacterium]
MTSLVSSSRRAPEKQRSHAYSSPGLAGKLVSQMAFSPMTEPVSTQDMHVHSTFSSGANTIEENVAEAERIGLTELACVEHVRGDTRWVPAYVAAVSDSRKRTPIALRCAVEAKILDIYGRLDLPAELDGIDAVYAASHQAPSPDGPMNPRSTRERIEVGELDPQMVLRWMVNGTAAAVRQREHLVIAHLFSGLPGLGLDERDVPLGLIDSLAIAAAESDARIVVDERRRCPAARTLRPFLRHGVPLLLGSGSDDRETVGHYDYCAGVLRELRPLSVAAA